MIDHYLFCAVLDLSNFEPNLARFLSFASRIYFVHSLTDEVTSPYNNPLA